MQKKFIGILALLGCVSITTAAFADTLGVRLRISNRKRDEKTITRGNLIKIQQFILKQGKVGFYSNMYTGANPFYKTANYDFYLNPDTAENLECDPKKSGFHRLTIRPKSKAQDLTIEFLDEQYVYVTVHYPADNLSVLQIRQFVERAMKELLGEIQKIEKVEPNNSDAGDGK